MLLDTLLVLKRRSLYKSWVIIVQLITSKMTASKLVKLKGGWRGESDGSTDFLLLSIPAGAENVS